MDKQSPPRPDQLASHDLDSDTILTRLGHLSPGALVFHHTTVKVVAPKKLCETKDQASQSDTQSTHASANTQTYSTCDKNQDTNKPTECFSREISRDETIRMHLEQHQIYISHCVKPDDIILHLSHCFSEEQKSDIQSEKNLIKASRKAIEMLLHEVEDPGRFAALRDALDTNDGYPKIVRILDGEYNPEDQNYVKVVELFTPEIIIRLDPSELMPRLLSKCVFKPIDIEEIRAEEKNHGKMRASCVLLMYLPRRTVDWFRSFLGALIECHLEDIAEMLDPDLFKDMLQKYSHDSSHRKANMIQKEKPKIPPKPLFEKGKVIGRSCVITKENNNTLTNISSGSENISHTDGVENAAAVGTPKPTEDMVEISDFDVAKVKYLNENLSEREKFDTSMAECDAQVIWPDHKRGKNKILFRSISKDDIDSKIWLRKQNVWKKNVKVTFNKLIKNVAQCKGVSPNFSKIISKRNTPCKRHITPVKSKQLLCTKFSAVQIESKEEEKQSVSEATCSKSVQKCAVCKMSCGRRIWIVKGSLVDLQVDVMVNTTDNHLSLKTGLAETISERGGETITRACARHIESQRSIDEGEIFVTEAGDLPAKNVVHVNSPVWNCDNEEESKILLKMAVRKSLLQASIKNAESIALPAISCGVSGFPNKIATTLIVRAVRNFFREEQESSLKHVYLVDIISAVVKRFREALESVFSDDKKCEIKDFNT